MKKSLLLVLAVLFTAFSYAQTGDVFVDASRADDSGDGLTWATAKKTISGALDVCDLMYTGAGGYALNTAPNMFVAQGTYNEKVWPNPPSAAFIYDGDKTAVKFYGGFPTGGSAFAGRNPKLYETILDGTGVVLAQQSSTPMSFIELIYATLMDGFIIQNVTNTQANRGALFLRSNAVVSNCIFRNNVSGASGASNHGATILIDANFGDRVMLPTLLNCEIYNNVYGSAAVNTNRKSSGAIHVIYGGAVIGCKIFNNNAIQPSTATATAVGAGIYVTNNFHLTNRMRSDVVIANNLIYNNSAKETSGIAIHYAQNSATATETNTYTYITNNTIVNNNAIESDKGAISVTLANLATGSVINTTPDKILISNNIIWGNKFQGTTSSQINETELLKSTFTYNAVEGTIPGTLPASNISLSATNETDVKFALPTVSVGYDASKTSEYKAANWMIAANSACINAGSSDAYNALGIASVDFAGTSRIKNGSIDIGAYEIDNTSTNLSNLIGKSVKILSVDGGIFVLNADQVSVFNSNGQLILNVKTKNPMIELPKGLFIVQSVSQGIRESNKVLIK